MVESAAKWNAAVLTVLPGQSVNNIADLCVSALIRQSEGVR
jgi:hypothetical protein